MTGRPVLAESARENVLLPDPAMPVTTTASSDRNPRWDVPYRSKLREALIRHQCILPDTRADEEASPLSIGQGLFGARCPVPMVPNCPTGRANWARPTHFWMRPLDESERHS